MNTATQQVRAGIGCHSKRGSRPDGNHVSVELEMAKGGEVIAHIDINMTSDSPGESIYIRLETLEAMVRLARVLSEAMEAERME